MVLAALPFLAEILHGDGQWARIATLDILIDLNASFAPEPGFETVVTPDGETKKLDALLREDIQRCAGAVAFGTDRRRISCLAE